MLTRVNIPYEKLSSARQHPCPSGEKLLPVRRINAFTRCPAATFGFSRVNPNVDFRIKYARQAIPIAIRHAVLIAGYCSLSDCEIYCLLRFGRQVKTPVCKLFRLLTQPPSPKGQDFEGP